MAHTDTKTDRHTTGGHCDSKTELPIVHHTMPPPTHTKISHHLVKMFTNIYKIFN